MKFQYFGQVKFKSSKTNILELFLHGHCVQWIVSGGRPCRRPPNTCPWSSGRNVSQDRTTACNRWTLERLRCRSSFCNTWARVLAACDSIWLPWSGLNRSRHDSYADQKPKVTYNKFKLFCFCSSELIKLLFKMSFNTAFYMQAGWLFTCNSIQYEQLFSLDIIFEFVLFWKL